MASHFSAIGFPVAHREDLLAFVDRAIVEGRTLPSPNGRYTVWAPGAGAELWIQADPEGNIVGCAPHFSGESRVQVGNPALVPNPELPLEGGVHGWASPPDEMPSNGAYPFVIDLPNFDLVRDTLASRKIVPFQIAAFAHELRCFATDTDFAADGEEGKPKFAAESFIPSGLFRPDGPAPIPPTAHAIFTGHVLKAEIRTNPATGAPFHALLVQSFEAVYDVVTDLDTPVGPITVGGVVQGNFWLSGYALDIPT